MGFGCMFIASDDPPSTPDAGAFVRSVLARWPEGRVLELPADRAMELEVDLSGEVPPFSIGYGPPVISCDGTPEQCAQVALVLQPLYSLGAPVWIVGKDASRGRPLHAGMTAEEVMANWVPYTAPGEDES